MRILAERNISRTPEEIREYLTSRFPRNDDFRRLIDIAVALQADRSYNEAERFFSEVIGYE